MRDRLVPVQTQHVGLGVVATGNRRKTADERIDANVSAARDASGGAAQSGVTAGARLVERDSPPRSVRADTDDPLECSSRGRTRNGEQSDSQEQGDEGAPWHLSKQIRLQQASESRARGLRQCSRMTPELVVGLCESERGSKHTDLHPWLLVR